MDFEGLTLHTDLSDRERRRYKEALRATAEAAGFSADGFEEGDDTKALAGAMGVIAALGSVSGELKEVIDGAMSRVVEQVVALDEVEVPDSLEGFDEVLGIENTDTEEDA